MDDATLTFGGEEQFAAPPWRVFAVLTDLQALADTMPDLVSAQIIDDHTLECVVRPGFSFLRGTIRARIELDDLDPPRAARMEIRGRGVGTTLSVESRLSIEPQGDGSRLTWSSRVTELQGLAATVSKSLVRAAAERIIRDTWQRIGQQIES